MQCLLYEIDTTMGKEKNLMEMIKASGLKKYYVTDNYEVHALDGSKSVCRRRGIPCNHRYIRKREDDLASDPGRSG